MRFVFPEIEIWAEEHLRPTVNCLVGQSCCVAHFRRLRYSVGSRPIMNNMKTNKKELSPKQREELLSALKARFEKNMGRHPGLVWAKIQARLEAKPDKLWSLAEMERTGGEPDVVGIKSGEFAFMDCSAQSPKGRVSFCYDREALDARKEHKPKNCVLDMAAAMDVEVLTEEEYFVLQKLSEFDTK